MKIKELIRWARTYRRYDEEARIDESFLRELVELARLSPSAANRQPLKYILSFTNEKNDLIFPYLAWAGYLKDWDGPERGQRPAGYIIVLGDTSISRNFDCDLGIAAQSMSLGAAEKGFGTCMIAAIDNRSLREKLDIDQRYEILMVLALGKPAEKIFLEDVKDPSDIEYYRDEKDVHHVPKRTMDELVIG